MGACPIGVQVCDFTSKNETENFPSRKHFCMINNDILKNNVPLWNIIKLKMYGNTYVQRTPPRPKN